jgi:nucleotide sugar dehydrogenase
MMIDKVKDRSARVCVIGLGYVGLPTAVALAEAGFTVIGADVDGEKVMALSYGKSPLRELRLDDRLKAVVTSGRFTATTNVPAAVKEADVVSIVVPTPVTEKKEPDLSHVRRAAQDVAEGLQRGQLIVLESTTYPGTTEEVVQPILEKRGLRAGPDFGLAYCPERYNPGDPEHTIDKTVRVLGAITPEWAEAARALYETIAAEVVVVRDIRTAEAAKIIENIQRDLNIALVNELYLIFDEMGIDTREVIDAAGSKWNFMKMYPGPGVGGHCLPVDPYYLTHAAQALGLNPKLILAGRSINDRMPRRVVSLIGSALEEVGKNLEDAKVAVLGLAYKAGVGDPRESPAETIVGRLLACAVDVAVHDPMVDDDAVHEIYGLANLTLSDAVDGADCIVLVTDHKEILDQADTILRAVEEGAALVDCRGAIDPAKLPPKAVYRGIGRIRR